MVLDELQVPGSRLPVLNEALRRFTGTGEVEESILGGCLELDF